MEEHRLIETVLEALEGYATAVEKGSVFERDDLARFVTFVREFADAKHHAKEEDILFAAMLANGFPREGGPIAVMLHEHELSRGYVRELADIAAGEGDWSEDTAARVAAAARSYTELLRDHIEKEDNVLYPMAQSVLPPDAMREVSERCEGVEQRHSQAGDTARLERLGAELAQRNLS
jgi:hemerythrin-like domain-containing protein